MRTEFDEFRIQDEVERSLLVTWSLTIFLTSVLGSSIILVATLKYNAIKVPRVTVVVMLHLTICDLVQALFKVLPVSLGFIKDRWVMGAVLCYVEVNMRYFVTALTIVLTAALTTLKLIVIRYPLRTAVWSSSYGNKICFGLWLFTLILLTPAAVGNMLNSGGIYFNYYDYTCDYYYLSKAYYQYYALAYYFVLGLGFLVVIATSNLLLYLVFSRGEKVRWRGVSIVLLTVAVLLLSYLPLAVAWVCARLGVSVSSTVARAVINLQNLNTMENFFVYALAVASFREFLRQKLARLFCSRAASSKRRPSYTASYQSGRRRSSQASSEFRRASSPMRKASAMTTITMDELELSRM